MSAESGALISKRGFCTACGLARAMKAQQQMASRHGPFYDAWRASGGASDGVAKPTPPAGKAARSARSANRQRKGA